MNTFVIRTSNIGGLPLGTMDCTIIAALAILCPWYTPLAGKRICLQTLKVGANDRSVQDLENELL